jgi:hypothetical protein
VPTEIRGVPTEIRGVPTEIRGVPAQSRGVYNPKTGQYESLKRCECGGRIVFYPRNSFGEGGGVTGFKEGYACMECGKRWKKQPGKTAKGTKIESLVPPPPVDEGKPKKKDKFEVKEVPLNSFKQMHKAAHQQAKLAREKREKEGKPWYRWTGKTEPAPEGSEQSFSESGHKPDCQCGFCKNKGSFRKKKEEPASEPADETSESAQEIARRLLENPVSYSKGSHANPVKGSKVAGNPGTEAPITGVETDRKFTPVKGMVQGDAENSIVNKQVKRKVTSETTVPPPPPDDGETDK